MITWIGVPVVAVLLILFAYYLSTTHHIKSPPRAVEEPDVITKLAAIGDPEGEAAKHVREWQAWVKYQGELLKGAAAAANIFAQKLDDGQ